MAAIPSQFIIRMHNFSHIIIPVIDRNARMCQANRILIMHYQSEKVTEWMREETYYNVSAFFFWAHNNVTAMIIIMIHFEAFFPSLSLSFAYYFSLFVLGSAWLSYRISCAYSHTHTKLLRLAIVRLTVRRKLVMIFLVERIHTQHLYIAVAVMYMPTYCGFHPQFRLP